jgi:hypothetical protein
MGKLTPALIVGVIVRHGLTMLAGSLVAHGAVTADFATNAVNTIVEPVAGLLVGCGVVVWSLIQKHKAAK